MSQQGKMRDFRACIQALGRALPAMMLAFLLSLPAGAAEPIPSPKPIFFAGGSSSGTVGGRVLRGERSLYSVKATAGQTMTITLTAPDDNAVFQIYEPGTTIGRDNEGLLEFHGNALRGATPGEDTTRWTGHLPKSGTYLIVVGGTRGNARYSMDVKIE
jgi:hypothetical protein